jgi:hypothetical protein
MRAAGSPQIFCIFLFLCAASLFGTLISQVNEIVNQKTSMSKELDEILEAYLTIEPRRAALEHRASHRALVE